MRTNKHEEDLYWGTHTTLKKTDDFHTQVIISNSLINNKHSTFALLKNYIHILLFISWVFKQHQKHRILLKCFFFTLQRYRQQCSKFIVNPC